MAIVLNHTIVPAHDKDASAKFFARIFGIVYEGAWGHFAPVRVNESLTLDFDNSQSFETHHYAFHVSDTEFDAIFGRIKLELLAIGNFRKKGLVVLFSTFLYGCGLAVFGLSHWFFASLLLVGVLGMLDAIGVSARQTIVQLLAPDRMRGRTTSISQIFAMGAPSLGYILAGVVAAMVGAPLTMVMGGAVVCSVVIGIAFVLRQVREYQA